MAPHDSISSLHTWADGVVLCYVVESLCKYTFLRSAVSNSHQLYSATRSMFLRGSDLRKFGFTGKCCSSRAEQADFRRRLWKRFIILLHLCHKYHEGATVRGNRDSNPSLQPQVNNSLSTLPKPKRSKRAMLIARIH